MWIVRAEECASGLISISGDLVQLETDPASLTREPELWAQGISVRVAAPGEDINLDAQSGEAQEADHLLQLDTGFSVGFRGSYACLG